MIKPVRPKETIIEEMYLHKGSCYGECLINIIDQIPDDIRLDQVHFRTDIEHGYYDDTTAVLEIYYNKEVSNKHYNKQLKFYEEQLEKYNTILEKEKYIKNNKDKYFKIGETIYLLWHKVFLNDLELASFKIIKEIKITKVLLPQSPNNKPMTSDHWCQIIYFDLNGKEVNSILHEKDIICRNKKYLTL